MASFARAIRTAFPGSATRPQSALESREICSPSQRQASIHSFVFMQFVTARIAPNGEKCGLNKRSKRCITFVVTPIAVTPDLILTLLHK